MHNVAPEGLLHGLGEELVKLRFVGLEMVQVDTEGFDSADIEYGLPDGRLDFRDMAGIALTGQDIDELTSFRLEGRHERFDASGRERFWVTVSIETLRATSQSGQRNLLLTIARRWRCSWPSAKGRPSPMTTLAHRRAASGLTKELFLVDRISRYACSVFATRVSVFPRPR